MGCWFRRLSNPSGSLRPGCRKPTRRDLYAGAVGYLDFAGNLDFCIAIRTITIREGIARVQAGAGIVADSVPSEEYQETLNKARGLLKAIEISEARVK